MAGREVNKRTVENFIKAGAFDSFGYTRRQQMMVYVRRSWTRRWRKRKKSMTGQMSLFDFVAEEEKEAFEVTLSSDVGEYDREVLFWPMRKKCLACISAAIPWKPMRRRGGEILPP